MNAPQLQLDVAELVQSKGEIRVVLIYRRGTTRMRLRCRPVNQRVWQSIWNICQATVEAHERVANTKAGQASKPEGSEHKDSNNA